MSIFVDYKTHESTRIEYNHGTYIPTKTLVSYSFIPVGMNYLHKITVSFFTSTLYFDEEYFFLILCFSLNIIESDRSKLYILMSPRSYPTRGFMRFPESLLFCSYLRRKNVIRCTHLILTRFSLVVSLMTSPLPV